MQKSKTPLNLEAFENGLEQILFEDLADGGLVVVDSEATIRNTNQRTGSVLSQERKDLLGKNFLLAIPLTDLKGKKLTEENHPLIKTLRTDFRQIQPFFCLYETLEKKQEPLALVLKTFPLPYDNGQKKGVLVQMRQAKRQFDLKDMQTTLVSLAAHQIKTPAGVTQGFLELALQKLWQDGKVETIRDYLGKAYEANLALTRAAKDLLNTAKLQGGLLQPDVVAFDLEEMMNNKQQAYALWVKTKKLDLKFFFDRFEKTKVNSDRLIVSEILDILLHNAIKYVPSGGKISVYIQYQKKYFDIVIEDNGPGFVKTQAQKENPPETELPVFSNTGHGLGLELAKKYTLLLKGTLELEEVKPNGTKATLHLPDWQ
jgi:signal transduction histidine kinase